MKFKLYPSLQSTDFQATLRVARVLGTLSILFIYLSLLIAGLSFGLIDTSGDPMLTPASLANQILAVGVGSSLAGLALSASLAMVISIQPNQPSLFGSR